MGMLMYLLFIAIVTRADNGVGRNPDFVNAIHCSMVPIQQASASLGRRFCGRCSEGVWSQTLEHHCPTG